MKALCKDHDEHGATQDIPVDQIIEQRHFAIDGQDLPNDTLFAVMRKPGMGRSGMGRPGMGRPGMGRSGMGRSGMGRPGMGRSGTTCKEGEEEEKQPERDQRV
jgi:hypothetical protein